MHLRHLWNKFSICVLNQVKKRHIPINVWLFSLRDSSDEDCVFDCLFKFLSLLLNEFLQSEIMQKSRSVQIITTLLQLLMNNQLQFVCLWCCVPLDFVVQIDNFFCLVLFSAVIHKGRGKKLISRTIKYKLCSSSKMQFSFFLS